MPNQIDVFKNLTFRRQFLLGRKWFKPVNSWNFYSLAHNLKLSVHPELEVVSDSLNGRFFTLIGTVINPLSPQNTMREITNEIINASTDLNDVIKSTHCLMGRWIMIFQDNLGTFLFTDPFGFRQVYYSFQDQVEWCGSQPEIINAANRLEWNFEENCLDFLMNNNLGKTESAWVGNKTVYDNCYHLLPNHYLDFKNEKQIRFYLPEPRIAPTPSSLIDTAVTLLKGSYDAISFRSNCKLTQALTAGWDSRVLLAASRKYSSNINYFVDRMGILSEHHPDVWVPKRLADKFSLNLSVRNSNEDPPGWFVTILSGNVTTARILPKSRMIFSSLKNNESRLKINGNGSEVCRNFFDKYCLLEDVSNISTKELVRLLGYQDSIFAENEIDEWRKDVNSTGRKDINILDMLYWEQRLGNWGAQFPAEQDIASEEFSPFNCRLLIETLLMGSRKSRSAPRYPLYRELIRNMWPEILSIPINPVNIHSLNSIKKQITSMKVFKVLK